jgi:hypothetical protein
LVAAEVKQFPDLLITAGIPEVLHRIPNLLLTLVGRCIIREYQQQRRNGGSFRLIIAGGCVVLSESGGCRKTHR